MAESLGTAVLNLAADYKSFLNDLDIAHKKADAKSKDMGSSIGGNLSRSFLGLNASLGLVKWPAFIASAGAAAQAVGVLGAGVVGLGSALAPLAGGYAAGVAGMVALKQATGVVSLAMMGAGSATEDLTKALEKPTPAANGLKKVIAGFIPQIVHLRNLAQGPIFRGLTEGASGALPILGVLAPVVRETANAIGDLAGRAGKLAGSMSGDFLTVGKSNVIIIKNMGDVGLNLAKVFMDILVAVQPLTRWLSVLVKGWSESAAAASNTARENGKMAAFFMRTKEVMEQVIAIGRDLGVALFNIFKGGTDLGKDMLADLVLLVAKFREWTESAKGENSIQAFFRDAKGPLYEVIGLVGDISKSFLRLSTGTGVGGMVKTIRPLVPLLEKLVSTTTASFGPVFIDAVAQVVSLFTRLAGTSGPLNAMMQTVSALASAMIWLLDNVPGLNYMVVTLLALAGIKKVLVLVLGPLIMNVKALALALNMTSLSALRLKIQLIATTAAMYVMRGITLAITAVQWLWNASLMGFPLVWIIAAIAAVIAIVVLAIKNWDDIKAAIGIAWEAIKGFVSAGAKAVVGAMSAAWSWIKGATSAVWEAIKGIISGALGAISGVVTGSFSAIKGVITGAWEGVKSATSSAWEAVSGLVSGAVSEVVGFVGGLPGKLVGALSSLGSSLKGVATSAWNTFEGAVKSGISAVIDLVKDIPGKIVSALGDLGSLLIGAGKSLIGGLVKGITGPLSDLFNTVSNIAGKIKDLKGPIKKDRTLLIDEGRAIIQGLGVGMHNEFERLKKDISTFAPNIQATVSSNPMNDNSMSANPSQGTNGPTVNIERMDVHDQFDEQALAANLAWRMATA